MNPVIRERARAIFAHHIGQGPELPGYGATAWRDWLICAPSCNYGWFAVSKADPTARPGHFPCSLADTKALLKEGVKGR
jgi:hypothetical protein